MLAERIGAVNTIVNHSGRLKGYNTDAQGFLKVLSKEGIDPRGEGFIILGRRWCCPGHLLCPSPKWGPALGP